MTTAIYTHPDCERHEMGDWHPESPARLQAIADQLIASGLAPYLEYREAPVAALTELARVHQASVIARVRDHVPKPDAAQPYFSLDPDTALNAYSWQAALRAAGAAVAATDAVIAGDINNAFCAIRPPGHHATPDASMGFSCSIMSPSQRVMRSTQADYSAWQSLTLMSTMAMVPKRRSVMTLAY